MSRSRDVCVFKINFEKTYDCVIGISLTLSLLKWALSLNGLVGFQGV